MLICLAVFAISIGDVTAGAIIAGLFTLLNTALNLWLGYLTKQLDRRQREAARAAEESAMALIELSHEYRQRRKRHND